MAMHISSLSAAKSSVFSYPNQADSDRHDDQYADRRNDRHHLDHLHRVLAISTNKVPAKMAGTLSAA
jgi:hypothetical protein